MFAATFTSVQAGNAKDWLQGNGGNKQPLFLFGRRKRRDFAWI